MTRPTPFRVAASSSSYLLMVLLLGLMALIALSVAPVAADQENAATTVRRGYLDRPHLPHGRYRSHWRRLPADQEALHFQRSAGPAAAQRLIRGFVALKENAAGLERVRAAAEAVSDPRHPHYGRHLSLDDVTAAVAPAEADVQRVVAWLRAAGVAEIEVARPSRSWIRFAAAPAAVEALVGCRLGAFVPARGPSSSKKSVVIDRCVEGVYNLPQHLDDIVDFVTPLVGFPKVSGSKRVQIMHHSELPMDQPNVTPMLLRKIYKINLPISSQNVNNTQAVFETMDSYSNADLQAFFQQFMPQLQGQRVKKTLGNLPNDPTNPDTEASLDIQYIMGVGAFAPTYSYNYNDENGDEIQVFLDYVTDLANDPKPPLVHSISYGEYGGDYDIREVIRVSNEFMKLAARGLTLLVASGDDGVGCNDWCSAFEFPYPSSPWITLVGATQVHQDNGQFSEIGSTFSTGGFSNDFGIPSWQASQVAYYLKNCPNLPASSYFNSSGRGLPDISAAGENVQVNVGGYVQPVAGTSCSAPIIGGMVSLWNGMRLQSGKSPLGFINPLLYQASSNAAAFYDVTSGNNADGCCPGFNAFKGWDPVTGLGTPNFEVLTQVIRLLP